MKAVNGSVKRRDGYWTYIGEIIWKKGQSTKVQGAALTRKDALDFLFTALYRCEKDGYKGGPKRREGGEAHLEKNRSGNP